MSKLIFVKNTDMFETYMMCPINMSQGDKFMPNGNSAENIWVIFQLLPGSNRFAVSWCLRVKSVDRDIDYSYLTTTWKKKIIINWVIESHRAVNMTYNSKFPAKRCLHALFYCKYNLLGPNTLLYGTTYIQMMFALQSFYRNTFSIPGDC